MKYEYEDGRTVIFDSNGLCIGRYGTHPANSMKSMPQTAKEFAVEAKRLQGDGWDFDLPSDISRVGGRVIVGVETVFA